MDKSKMVEQKTFIAELNQIKAGISEPEKMGRKKGTL
jgi:hypothetical protein